MAARLLIVDDHAMVREGLRHVLESGGTGWEVSEACSGQQALELLRREPFTLAIVDLSMPGMSGLDLLRRLRDEHPQLPVLVLSMHAEKQYALRAYRAGAQGYLTKDSAASVLIGAVRKLVHGGAYVSARMAEDIVMQLVGSAAAPSHALLSDRELQVLSRIVGGQRLTDIAEELHLSVKTVSTHKSRILEKLQLPTTAALIRYGMENDIVFEPPAGRTGGAG